MLALWLASDWCHFFSIASIVYFYGKPHSTHSKAIFIILAMACHYRLFNLAKPPFILYCFVDLRPIFAFLYQKHVHIKTKTKLTHAQ